MSELSKAVNEALDRIIADEFDRTNRRLVRMPKAERDTYMEAKGMYYGPHYDPSFEADPAQWWRDYRDGKKPNAVDPFV